MADRIEGVPEGWELLRIGGPAKDDWFIGENGKPLQALFSCGRACPIIRKIEKPAKYRPFANAEEFKPHRDRWLTRKDKSYQTHSDGACRVVGYCDTHLWWADGRSSSYKEEFNQGRCFDDDGTPFGVRIDE